MPSARKLRKGLNPPPPRAPDPPVIPPLEGEAENAVVEGLADPHRSRSTLRLLGRAVREGWGIPSTSLGAIPKRLAKIAESEISDETHVVGAARVLVAMRQADLMALREQYHDERTDEGLLNARTGVTIELGDETIAALARTLTDGNRDPG